MREPACDPGLLRVFRVATGLRLAILAVLALAALDAPPRIQRAALLYAAEAGTLMLLLVLPGLPQRLGRAYLPGMLVAAAVLPVLFRQGVLAGRAVVMRPLDGPAFIGPSPLSLWAPELWVALLVPTVVAAWQYDLRAMLGLVLGTTVLDTALLAARSPFPLTGSFLVLPLFRTGALLLVGVAVVYLAGLQRARREALERVNAQLARHAAVVEQLATTSERNRLARELHDTLAHSLSAVAVQLEAVRAVWETDPAGARALLDQALATTRSGLQEARRALAALRASPLEDMGLPVALRTLAESVAARVGAVLTVRTPEAGARFPPEVEQSVYRVAQEALENIARHADARHVAVTLEAQDGSLRLTVSDDGRGFDPSAGSADGFGLMGMRERAELLGGRIVIDSRPGGPTTLRLEVPVRP